MRLLVFNPENDLALAAASENYTPPASAIQMARDLADLPRLWTRKDDYIWHHAEPDASLPADVAARISEIQPWGWSPRLIRQLQHAGVSTDLLPTTEQMQEFRTATGRELSQHLLDCFFKLHDDNRFTGRAVRCNTLDDVRCWHSRFGHSLMKAPWSGSGRGIHPLPMRELSEKSTAWAERCLCKQGYVMLEPFYDKVQDFAMEFWLDKDGVMRYEGLSVFQTTAGGVYSGNIVASEQYKADIIGQYVDAEALTVVRSFLMESLPRELQTFYTGPVGVDMMVVNQNGYKLHPCVEVNVRTTMGWVALQLSAKADVQQPSLFQIQFKDGRYSVV